MTTTKTTAEQVAEIFSNDGLTWVVEIDGEDLDLVDVMIRHGAMLDERGPGREERWIFPDGSVITLAEEAWDLGYTGCFCWAGIGHNAGCDSEE